MKETYFIAEIAPSLVIATILDTITFFFLFRIYYQHHEIRGRLLPLLFLPLLHALCFPLMGFFPLHKEMENNITEIALPILGSIYVFSIPLSILFVLIYTFVLGIKSRMNKKIGCAFILFILNMILQFFFIVTVIAHGFIT